LAMLDLSKLESEKVSLDLGPLDLLDIVDETLESMIYLFEKKDVHLITELESAPIMADDFKMRMVVNNFISNALRYTDTGKDVTIHLDEHTFFVENEGQHISEEELEKIWITFYKVDKARNEEGTGLGLAICKAILELHHFEYGVKNTEKGVLFYVKY
ncbi:MAG: HAMP domain-containing sensor histidine kinase, partial [Coprobacillus sp.]